MNRNKLDVYFIMGSQNSPNPLETLEQALKAGITCFQLREKGEGCLEGAAYEAFALACQQLCQRYDVPFIVNDDVALALKIEADGIHLGQDDMAITTFRALASNKIVGVSVHTMAELKQAIESGADYAGIGPIFPTKSKPDAKRPAGFHFLQAARHAYPNFPIVAIGGIDECNAQLVRANGADGVAVISVICESTDITKTIQLLRGEKENGVK